MAGGDVPFYVFLLRARNTMDQRYAEPLDVTALAETAYVSRAHFIRSFKRAFGETPHQYLIGRRVERAKELLRHGTMPVTDVCVAVGFTSLGSFSTTFRALVRESPSEYARRWRRQAPPPVPRCFLMMGTRPSTFREVRPAGSS